MLRDIRWHNMVGTRWSENGNDVTDSWRANNLARAWRKWRVIAATERLDTD